MNVAIRTASPETAPQPADPLDHLADALFHKMGTDGVYARTALYEDMVERLAALITRHREPDTEVMRFPPVMNRGQLEKSGYLKSFPESARLRLRPARHRARNPLRGQPLRRRRRLDHVALARRSRAVAGGLLSRLSDRGRRGPLPSGGLRFDVAADCFRREPSRHLDRLQSFRMREYVCIGSPDDVSDFRERWMVRAQGIARDLGLDLQGRLCQRSLLRPGRPDEGGQPEAAIAEIRAAGPAALRGAADRLHELQLSPRPFRHRPGTSRMPAASRRIPAAWRSAWTGWRSPCSIPTAPISPNGRPRCAKRSALRLTDGSVSGRAHPKLRCREISEADLDAVADLLTRGFAGRSRDYWMPGLRRQAAREVPARLSALRLYARQ